MQNFFKRKPLGETLFTEREIFVAESRDCRSEV